MPRGCYWAGGTHLALMGTPENRGSEVRDGNGRWPSGVSGNPGGRPRALRDLQMAARRHDGQVLDALVSIALDPAQPAAARVVACREVLDRGHGRPRQAVELTGADAGLVQIEDVRECNLRLIATVAGRIAGAASEDDR